MATNQAKVVLSAEDKTAAAFAAVSRNVDKLGFNLGTLRGLAGTALGALAVPVSAGAIASLLTESSKAIDELKDLSEAVGSSVESISALDGIARDTGASLETVSSVLVKFNGVLKDADPDKGAGAVLKALNLDIEELKRLDPAEALRQTAVALSNYADDGDKARAVQELFGKSVKEAGPFLKDLAEAGALQARVTTQQAEEVDKFNKEWAKFKATTQDVGRSISINLITEVNDLISRLEKGESAWDAFFGAAEAGSRRLNGLAEPAKNETDAETARLARAAGLYSPDNQSSAETARLQRRPTLNVKGTPDGGNGGNRPRGGGGSAPKDPYAEANRYLESLRKQLQATEELSVYEKLLADIRDGSIGKLTPQLQAQLEATAKQIDADKELNAITKEFAELNAKSKADQAALAAEGARIWEDTRTPLERLNIEQSKLDKLLKAGVITFDTWARKSFDLEEALRNGPARAISELDQFTQRAAQNMQDYLGSSFQQIMEGNFDNIGDAFVSMLNNMVAQAAAAQLSKYLFGDLLTGGTAGGKGTIGDFIGSAASSLFGGFRADGGDVHRGKGYIVGERGPEWFEPATSGMVVPNHALGGTTQHINVSVVMPQGATRETAMQFGAVAGRRIAMAQARNG